MRSLLTLILALVTLSVHATDRYVRAGATGNGSGSNWTNAYTTLPASLTRGDTYYIADGTYSGYTFDDAVNGQTITVRKCTAADGVSSGIPGYSSAYCDGQATFGTFTINANDIVIDGAKRNENNWADGSSYGFKTPEVYASTFTSPGNICPDNITVRYTNFGTKEGSTYSGSEADDVIYIGGFSNNCSNWLIEYGYLHNVASYTMIQAVRLTDSIIQYNLLRNGWGKEAIRGQLGFSNNTIRYNKFQDACGYTGLPGEGCTAEIAAWGESGSGLWDGNKIYGNAFYRTRDENSGGTIVIGGNGSTWLGSAANNTLIYNNTIAGINGSNVGGNIVINGGSGNTCRNNLWYHAVGTSCQANTSSDNVVAASDPFVNYSAGDLRLTAAEGAGFALPAPFNRDMMGASRGGDGNWDVGAYEYGGESGLPAPTNLHLQNQ